MIVEDKIFQRDPSGAIDVHQMINAQAGIGSKTFRIKEVIVLYPRKRGAKTDPQHTVLSKTSELQQSLLSILDLQPATWNAQPMWLAEVARLLPELHSLYPDLPAVPAQAR